MHAPTEVEKDQLDLILRTIEQQVTDIRGRLEYLEAVQAEMTTQVGEQKFRIKNGALWRMLLDSVDMTVIDLASFCTSLWQRGGLLLQLNSVLGLLRRADPKTIQIRPVRLVNPPSNAKRRAQEQEMHDGIVRQLVADSRGKAFDRLFPQLKGLESARARPKDVAALRSWFTKESRALIADRNKNRAHRFEEKIGAPRLGLEELRKHFDLIEQILTDLRLVAHGSQFAFNTHHIGDLRLIARDVVDLVRFGSINQLCASMKIIPPPTAGDHNGKRYFQQFRDAWRPPADRST